MIEEHKNHTEKILKKGFRLYFFSFIIAPIGYIIKIIISNELTVSEVGVLYGVMSLIVMISAYHDFGMSESINHFVPDFVNKKRYDKVKTILTYALIAQMSTGISIALIFFFGADWLEINYFKSPSAGEVLKIFCLFFLAINVFVILQTFFMAVQDTFLNKLTEFLRMGFTLAFIVGIFLFSTGNIISFSYGWIAGVYIGTLVAIILFYKKYYATHLKKEKIIWEKGLFLQIFKYALLVFLGAQASTILSQIDMQMVIYMLGTTDAGYYTNYLSIIGMPFIIIGPILGFLFPLFSEMHSKKEHSKIRGLKEMFTNNFLLVAIAINVFLFVFAIPATYIFFGEKFLTSGVILQYSILLLTFNFLLQINFSILAGIGRVFERAKIIGIAIIINIITNWVLIKMIGVAGASLATGIGWVVIRGLSEYTLGKEYLVKINWKIITKNTLILGILAGIVLYLGRDFSYFINNYSRGELLSILVGIGAIYFGIFVIINYTLFRNFILEVKKLKGK